MARYHFQILALAVLLFAIFAVASPYAAPIAKRDNTEADLIQTFNDLSKTLKAVIKTLNGGIVAITRGLFSVLGDLLNVIGDVQTDVTGILTGALNLTEAIAEDLIANVTTIVGELVSLEQALANTAFGLLGSILKPLLKAALAGIVGAVTPLLQLIVSEAGLLNSTLEAEIMNLNSTLTGLLGGL